MFFLVYAGLLSGKRHEHSWSSPFLMMSSEHSSSVSSRVLSLPHVRYLEVSQLSRPDVLHAWQVRFGRATVVNRQGG